VLRPVKNDVQTEAQAAANARFADACDHSAKAEAEHRVRHTAESQALVVEARKAVAAASQVLG
jgi:hypothetical protein